jgi:branched-chain amino acid transport system substrate-binding protein
MKKKNVLFLLMTVLLAVALLASGCGKKDSSAPGNANQSPGQAEVKEPLKIGAIFATTGGAASLGTPARDTVIMLEEQINAAGGINGHPLKVIIYDTETDGTKALLAAKKLVEEDKVPVVIGPSTSGESLALVPYFQEEQIPLISVAAAARIVEPVEERYWIFKTPQSDYLVFEAMVRYFKQHNLMKVGFISEATGFGDSGRLELEKLAPKWGIDVVAWERFDRGDRDMTAQLTRIRRANPDAIVVWSIPPAASVVQQNIYDLRLNIPVIQSHGIGNMQFIEVAGQAAEGVIFPAAKLLAVDSLPDNDPQKKLLLKYKEDFIKKHGYSPPTFGGLAYDALMITVEAYKSGARTPQEIRDFIEQLQNHVGATGIFNFSPKDHNGLALDSQVWIEIRDGKWNYLQAVE